MNKRMLIIFSAMFFLGMLLIGNGITGLYIMEFKQPPCNEDKDCTEMEVCCFFYNEDFGVCDTEEKCKAIERATFDARQSFSTFDAKEEGFESTTTMVSSHVEGPTKSGAIYSALVGMFLVLFALGGYAIGKIRDIHQGRSRPLYRHHKK